MPTLYLVHKQCETEFVNKNCHIFSDLKLLLSLYTVEYQLNQTNPL